jgi:hypothetical protein
LLNWGNFCLKDIVNNFIFEIDAFSDKTSTLHKPRLSKPSFDTLLNKSKRVDLVVLKRLWKNNTLNIFMAFTVGQEPLRFPRSESDTPNWGKNFVKIFAISRNVPNWGKFSDENLTFTRNHEE